MQSLSLATAMARSRNQPRTNRWSGLFSFLEESAVRRAQEGAGPPEHSLDHCAELMMSPGVGCPGDAVEISSTVAEAVAVVLGQAERRVPKSLFAGVALIRGSQMNACGAATVSGDFFAGDYYRGFCRTGAASAAATYLMTVGTDPTHAPRTTFIPFVRRTAETEWTITRDPVIALRHMDATERLRLRSLGLFP